MKLGFDSVRMKFLDAVKFGIKNWITFSGRTSRSEYWWIMLSIIIFGFVYVLISILINRASPDTWGSIRYMYIAPYFFLFFVSTSAGVHRLHDLNLSGWWYGGYLFIDRLCNKLSEQQPAFDWIGAGFGLVLVVFFVRRGTIGPNRFGPDPLHSEGPPSGHHLSQA